MQYFITVIDNYLEEFEMFFILFQKNDLMIKKHIPSNDLPENSDWRNFLIGNLFIITI